MPALEDPERPAPVLQDLRGGQICLAINRTPPANPAMARKSNATLRKHYRTSFWAGVTSDWPRVEGLDLRGLGPQCRPHLRRPRHPRGSMRSSGPTFRPASFAIWEYPDQGQALPNTQLEDVDSQEATQLRRQPLICYPIDQQLRPDDCE